MSLLSSFFERFKQKPVATERVIPGLDERQTTMQILAQQETILPESLKDTAYIMTNDGNITLVRKGTTHAIGKTHPSYAKIVAVLNEQRDYNRLDRLLDIRKTIKSASGGKVEVNQFGEVFYNGEPAHNAVATRISEFAKAGLPYAPLMRFLENLMLNPSQRAIGELYTFLEHGGMPITADGYFIAYKGVNADFTDIHTGTFDNSVGAVNEMERQLVDPDCNTACSTGFHVGTYAYAANFGKNGKLLLVKVNPRDAVSVPKDENASKLRVCRYEVLAMCNGLISEPTYGDLSEDDTSSEDESPLDYIDEGYYDECGEEGYNAYEEGTPISDNPYVKTCLEYDAWNNGWNNAKTSLNDNVPTERPVKRPACTYCGAKGGKRHDDNCGRPQKA